MKEKEFKNLDFDEIVKVAFEIILNSLMDGKLRTGVYQACQMIVNWAEQKKNK